MTLPRLVVAGTHSGAGKTTVTLALTLALRDRDLTIQPFKVGPDYLDPTYHTLAAGRPCRNLDGWMMGEAAVRRSFARASEGAALSIIEGVMGLFDGAGPASGAGSTAEIATWLAAPVILVIDASGMATTAAALALGCAQYDPKAPLAGVIFNRVGSARHLAWLKEAVERATPLKVLGGLPKEAGIAFPERHLGLIGADRTTLTDVVRARLISLAREWLDLRAIMNLAGSAPPLDIPAPALARPPRPRRIGIARDEAFSFYYPDNLDLLQEAGAELVFFSPLNDDEPPTKLDAIYLGGGYPELHAARLAAGKPMREAIACFGREGGVIYAECGGLMYLARALYTLDDARHPMVGLLPGEVRMLPRRKALGYREVEAIEDLPHLAKGERARGHEFHYSEWAMEPAADGELARAYAVAGRQGDPAGVEGYRWRNVVASYVHLHFSSNETIPVRWG
ncbi:MAG: cobyrinate a,c-diamide synthase [Nitrospirae bacterium]|nr:cobyrinate a,c-diamide synthase [Nitrospirota bacterium]